MKCKLLILALMCSFFFAYAQKKKKAAIGNNTQTATVDYKSTGATMPEIRLVVPVFSEGEYNRKKMEEGITQTKIITNQDLNNNANLLVMMFNPTCGHCEEQTDLFTEHISLFRKSKLILMAGAPMLPYLQHFNNGRKTDKYPGTIIMGVDSAQFIDKTFRYESLPQTNIYDHERKLIRSFTGLVSIDSLKEYIE